MLVRDVLEALEEVAPSRYAFSFDRIGLQVGHPQQEVTGAVFSLDPSLAVVKFAGELGCNLIVAHHPLIWEPLKGIRTDTRSGRILEELIKSGTSFIGCHTNWDCAKGGVNDVLARMMGLSSIKDFGMTSEGDELKLAVCCPVGVVDGVIDAASSAGAGKIGKYTRCAFKAWGEGTFIGSAESSPAVGEASRVEKVEEARIEMVLPREKRAAVEEAVRSMHPYEEPAIDFFVLSSSHRQTAGRIGKLEQVLLFRELVAVADLTLNTKSMAWGNLSRKISNLAVVGGAADDEWRAAQRAGADAMLTGEVKHHNAVEASESGFNLIAAGHFATESPAMKELAVVLSSKLPGLNAHFYEPEPGSAGRPI